MSKVKLALIFTLTVLLSFSLSGLAEAGGPFFGPLGGPAVVCPYVTKNDPNQTTIVSLTVPSVRVSNPDNGDLQLNADAAELHYVYLFKNREAAQTDVCEEYNFKGQTSPNDLVTFDTGGMFGDEPGKEGYPLFNDTTSDPLIAG